MRRSSGTASIRISCRFAAGPGQRVHEPLLDHVLGNTEDRNGRRHSLCRANRRISDGINDIDLGFDKVRRQLRNQVNVQCI